MILSRRLLASLRDSPPFDHHHHAPMITHHKHVSVRSNTHTVTEHYAPVTKYTRAGNNGKRVMCPICGHVHRIYHFSWSALSCAHCTSMVDKYDWMVDQLDTWRTPR